MNSYNRFVICDLDGCLSDDRHRRHLLPKRAEAAPEEYDLYHAGAGLDGVVEPVVNDLRFDTTNEEGHQVADLIFVTARPDHLRLRDVTERWLNAALPGLEFTVLMRPHGNVMPSPELKVCLVTEYFERLPGATDKWALVDWAYDDRQDVLDAYPIADRFKHLTTLKIQMATDTSVPSILERMAATFRERNAIYGDNGKYVAPVIRELWPGGVPPELVASDRWHLFELLVVKVTRFARSNLTHTDSIHDAAVYSAMIESDILTKEGQ